MVKIIIPGLLANHTVLKPKDREKYNPHELADELFTKLKYIYLSLADSEENLNATFHVVLTVERENNNAK